MKTLIVVDVQNDFITGALKNDDALAAIPGIIEKIKNWDGAIVFTRDTHYDGLYEASLEGQYLPAEKGLKHCIQGTEGWMIRSDVAAAAKDKFCVVVDKPTFGFTDWNAKENEMLQRVVGGADEIYLCGFCTEICVNANATILRALFPDKKIKVFKDLTEGVSKDGKEAALKVMAAQEIEIV